MNPKKSTSTLYIVPTPIGNLADISFRALLVLKRADVIVCENPYHTSALLRHLKLLPQHYVKKPKETGKIETEFFEILDKIKDGLTRRQKPVFIAFGAYKNTSRLVQEVVNLMTGKKINVALVSSAGTPLLSDPGLSLVKAVEDHNLAVKPIPGPSALVTALTVSGFNLNYFAFLGMLPKKAGQRQKLLSDWQKNTFTKLTLAAYVSKHQLVASLRDILSVFGPVTVFVANDLTKFNEQGYKAKVDKLIDFFGNLVKIKGEFVLVFSPEQKEPSPETR